MEQVRPRRGLAPSRPNGEHLAYRAGYFRAMNDLVCELGAIQREEARSSSKVSKAFSLGLLKAKLAAQGLLEEMED